MDKHYNALFDETYYTAKLENGLKLIIFHKPDFHSTSVAFGTPYGAFDLKERINGQIVNFNPGIAHFLEHKLFESDHGDVMNEFFNIGASVNAFTSYRETVYYFNIPGKDIQRPLNLLLDFVQNLAISEASVEKEKDIIIQELNMYLSMPDTCLLNTTFKAMYHNYPLKYDIGGDSASVKAITKEELERCYAYNYHPANMYLVVTTPLEPEKILAMTENNQKNKSFAGYPDLEVLFDDEPLTVKEKDVDIHFAVHAAKHIYGIKLKPHFADNLEASKAEWAMRFILECQFSSMNPDYQKWLDDGLINDFFGYETDFDKHAAYLLFYGEGRSKYDLQKLIDESLKKPILNEELMMQLKRRYSGAALASFNETENFNIAYIRDVLSGVDIFDTLRIIDELTIEEIYAIFNSFDYHNYTLVSLLPNS